MEGITAHDIWKAPPTVSNFTTLNHYTTIIQTIERLSKSGISSAPVIDTENKIIGLIDLLDLVTFSASKLALHEITPESFELQIKEFDKPIVDIMNISGRNELVILPTSASFKEVVSKLSQPSTHRVVLTTDNGLSEGIITQSKLIEFLFENKNKIENLSDGNMDTSKWKSKIFEIEKWNGSHSSSDGVEVIHMKKTLLEAFSIIWEKKVSGVAVVDDDGKIVGNVSASDLKRVQLVPSSAFAVDLLKPIKVFCNIKTEGDSYNMEEVSILGNLPRFSPIIVSRDDTIEKATDLMLRFRIHRVYVVDDQQKPIQVISMRDVIQLFNI